MSWYTKLRDAGESAAAIVGNIVVPGSSLITSQLTSKGSQEQLASPIGQIAQIGSSLYGLSGGTIPGTNLGSIIGTPLAGTGLSQFMGLGAKAQGAGFFTQAAGTGTLIGTSSDVATRMGMPGNIAAGEAGRTAALESSGGAGGGIWDKIGGYLEKNPIASMMGLSTLTSAIGGISAGKTAQEKLDFEKQQYADKQALIAQQQRNINAPASIAGSGGAVSQSPIMPMKSNPGLLRTGRIA